MQQRLISIAFLLLSFWQSYIINERILPHMVVEMSGVHEADPSSLRVHTPDMGPLGANPELQVMSCESSKPKPSC